jgi:protein-histidine pros-kinase
MGLRAKFNIVLISIFALGIVVSGFITRSLLSANARDEVLQNAGVMMAAASAIRVYTVEQVKPHLEMQLMRTFLAQSVPAYAATETFTHLRENYPEFSYKEATLNPTNPRDRATDWEADVIHEFRNSADKMEIVGERETPSGPSLYLARPIKITKEACLTCHSTPEAAPKTLVAAYGESNGFSWKLNEIVGAQIVSVPMSLPIKKASRTFYTFMGSLCAMLLLVVIVLNFVLRLVVIDPIEKMASNADAVSTGNMEIPELDSRGKDEISLLAGSFNRMRRSLEKAIKMLEGN